MSNFFNKLDEYRVTAVGENGGVSFTVEEMYEAFKVRMLAEARAELQNGLDTLSDDEIAEAALDCAVGFIQQTLGVETGDLAGQFFTGEDGDVVRDIFKRYIRAESHGEEI